MSADNYILDEQLPLSQDFRSLKAEGLNYIQQYSAGEWTNLNASDPGVTILDQVCFALTELGYCNDFPLEDILTGPDGKLRVDDQFYLPENILTTSPITLQDYRKYVIDGVAGVKNAIVVPATTAINAYIYQVYLLIDQSLGDQEKTDIGRAAFFYLNKCRNIGELFLQPLLLEAETYLLNGTIEIASQTGVNDLLALIDNSIKDYIFPNVTQKGYNQLVANGLETNEIFNGPLLKNGWIHDADLGEKKDQINAIDLSHIIESIPGVKSVTGLSFGDDKANILNISSGFGNILTIDLAASLQKELGITCNGVSVTMSSPLKTRPAQLPAGDQFGNAVNIHSGLPQGRFREINDYYSIQNTFPEIFAVGADAIVANASAFQIAQSRQLKGYLTLFDQVLANQFSQLANISNLFSFKNSLTGASSDTQEYYEVKDAYEEMYPDYPVPFEQFSPTYYYQSLYDVPHIRHLLKDNDIFKFSVEVESEKELEKNSWNAYKLDPYNPYMRGLMDFMEDEHTSITRRNDILDHLLARHGESPLLIDAIIKGSAYAADTLMNKVIFKSLYLQNLGLLSYYRYKAYNFIGANKISGAISEISADAENKILDGYTKDFLFDSPVIDRMEKLTESDFIHYSALELKLSLLFGLKARYQNFIADNTDIPTSEADINLAMWMITQRKGVMLVETCWLLKYFLFEVVITSNTTAGPYWQINEALNYEQAITLAHFFSDNRQTDLVDEKMSIIVDGSTYTFTETNTGNDGNKFYKPIASTSYYFTFKTNSGIEIERFDEFPIFKSDIELVFPAFIAQADTVEFKNRLEIFLQSTLPVQISYECHFIGADQLTVFIPAFVSWHNGLVYNEKAPLNY